MDVLSDILGAVKMRCSLYFWTEFTGTWGVSVPPYDDVARFHLVLRGSCWARVGDDPELVRLEAGDLIVVPHGAGHTLADAPGTPCVPVDRVVERTGFTGRGLLSYGGDGDGGTTRMVCGHLEFDPAAGHPFLRQLPSRILIRQPDGAGSARLEETYRLIAQEVRDARPGSDAVLNRLSEVMFIQAVRVWADSREHDRGLMVALVCPNLSRGLAAIHEHPERAWTLAALARETGLSRTLFAERFHRQVGMTPMQYLTFWRMQRARALLSGGQLTLEAAAGRVGYESTAAFCRVFKKLTGENPGAFRRRRRSNGEETAPQLR